MIWSCLKYKVFWAFWNPKAAAVLSPPASKRTCPSAARSASSKFVLGVRIFGRIEV
jgi:hypothetical protein